MKLDQLLDKLAQNGDKRLMAYQDGQLFERTFAELAEDVDGALRSLRGAGVQAGMRVGILAGNSYEWVVHDLALLHLGAVVVPFPDEKADQGLESLREQYGLSLFLIDDEPPLPARWIGRIDGLCPLDACALPDAGRVDNPDELSRVFSSGSSGWLKCMSVSRRGTEVGIEVLSRIADLKPDDWFLLFLPMSHFQQRALIWMCIWYGANFAVAGRDLIFRAIKETRPTILLAPPLLYEMVERGIMTMRPKPLVRSVLRLLETLPDGTALRLLQRACSKPVRAMMGGRPRILATGMAPSRISCHRLFENLGLPIYEGYGTTETGQIAVNTEGARRVGSVGRPVREGVIRLAEDGEVLVKREDALTLGYLDDEERHRQTYLESGWIATGDIGRFDDDGFLFLLGRKQATIVTSGGDKLHPEVLERDLNLCVGVAHSMVCAVGGPQLVAILSVLGESDETRRAVERCVSSLNRGRAAQLHIGQVVYTTTEFSPGSGLLTRSLKMDRRAIRARFASHLERGDGHA